jgi:pyruvate formate lyase activating enzyme
MNAKLYLKDRRVKCLVCWNLCEIEDGDRGYCGVRVNRGGKLETLSYGNLSAVESRPIEIKPFYHFLPGSTSITFSTYSCNLSCPWCQNWHISKTFFKSKLIPPEKIIEMAVERGDRSTCASLNEPTLLFEYLLDLFPIARRKNLLNTIVSNGYMTPKCLKMLISAGLDAMNIDIKGNDAVYKMISEGKSKYIWRNARFAFKKGVHVEMVFLQSPPVYRNPEIVDEVIESHLRYLGSDVPLHFTRYFPAYLSKEPPTPVDFMEESAEKARSMGIHFVYIGNLPHKLESTFCPRCGRILIRRRGVRVLENNLLGGKCRCGMEIYGVFEDV